MPVVLSEGRKAYLRRVHGLTTDGPQLTEEDYIAMDSITRQAEAIRGNSAMRARPTTVIVDDLAPAIEAVNATMSRWLESLIHTAQNNALSPYRPTLLDEDRMGITTIPTNFGTYYTYSGISPSGITRSMLERQIPRVERWGYISAEEELPLVNVSPSGVNLNESGVNMDKSVVEDYESLVKKDKVTTEGKIDPTTDLLFNDFLGGSKLLPEFREEWAKPSILSGNLKIWDRNHYISGSFDWHRSKRGYSFWSTKSTIWRKIVQSLGEGGSKIPEVVKKYCE